MANRSDFERATLPRYLKKMMAIMDFKDEHERGAFKRDFIAAHANHKAFKNKKRVFVDNEEVTE